MSILFWLFSSMIECKHYAWYSMQRTQCTEVADIVLLILSLIITIITNLLSVRHLLFPTCHKFVAWTLNSMKHNVYVM